MESAKRANESIFRGWRQSVAPMRGALGERAYKTSLKWLRRAIDAADEWLHARELALANAAIAKRDLAGVDPVASAAREKDICGRRQSTQYAPTTPLGTPSVRAVRMEARTPFTGTPRRPRTKSAPRLCYRAGEFVREA